MKQINQGVATTRNRGITAARGEYIYFIDADDFIDVNAIEILAGHSDGVSSDIILGNYYEVKNNQNKKNMSLKNRTLYPRDLKNTETKVNMFLTKGRPLASSCNKLYKSTFLKKNELKFRNNVFAEDRLFNLMCYLQKPIITIINDYTYYYNIIDDSRSRTFSKNFFTTNINLIHELSDYLNKNRITEENKDLFQITVIYDINKILENYYNYYRNIKGLNESLELIKSDKLIHNTLKQLNREKILKKISIFTKYYIKFNILIKLYLNTPKHIAATYYYFYNKIAEVKINFKKRFVK